MGVHLISLPKHRLEDIIPFNLKVNTLFQLFGCPLSLTCADDNRRPHLPLLSFFSCQDVHHASLYCTLPSYAPTMDMQSTTRAIDTRLAFVSLADLFHVRTARVHLESEHRGRQVHQRKSLLEGHGSDRAVLRRYVRGFAAASAVEPQDGSVAKAQADDALRAGIRVSGTFLALTMHIPQPRC